jgi:hypothetical protein
MGPMRRPIAIAAALGTLLAGGTAIAAGGRPFDRVFGADGRDGDAQLAKELASRLDGVSADQVQRALDDLRHDKRAEFRRQQAEDLAKHLDGVSVAEAEKALAKVESGLRAKAEKGRERGLHRVDFVAELAKALGKSESDVRKALQAAQKERFDARLDQAVKDGRLTQEQADRIKKRFEDGKPFLFRGRGRGPGHFGFRGHLRGPGPGVEGGPPPGPVGPGGFDTAPAPPPHSL